MNESENFIIILFIKRSKSDIYRCDKTVKNSKEMMYQISQCHGSLWVGRV